MVKIRLKRTGGKNWISFRIVVCDIRKQRDGKMVEELGYYDPKHSDGRLLFTADLYQTSRHVVLARKRLIA